MRVHLKYEFESGWMKSFRAELDDDIELTVGDIDMNVADYRVLIHGRPDREQLMLPSLHSLIIPWAGIPEATAALLAEFPKLDVYNLHHNAIPTAEQAFALLMAAARGTVVADAHLRRDDWTPRYLEYWPTLLYDKRVLVLGYGAIGKTIARYCLGFGMTVAAVRRHVTAAHNGEVAIYTPDAMHELLPNAQVLFISLPHTPETDGLIGVRELGLLPQNAILVNISRGKVIDQAALYHALKTRRIRAGLDVWYNYPGEEKENRCHTAPADYPFHELDNVVMSPHMGGNSDETEMLRIRDLANAINALARGGIPANRVDPARGY